MLKNSLFSGELEKKKKWESGHIEAIVSRTKRRSRSQQSCRSGLLTQPGLLAADDIPVVSISK